jgi:GDP-L-fucose synthase
MGSVTMEKRDKVFVAGHEGMIGSAILRRLKEDGFRNLAVRTSTELDLTDQKKVYQFFIAEKPDHVFLASAKVGGILANSRYPAQFIYHNIQVQTNVIHSAWKSGVKKLLFLGSSCIYPKSCPQPMKEEYLLTDKLEPTSEPYAIAKIAGIKMCQSYNSEYGTNYISAIPADLYGPQDDFDPETSHVLPALIGKIHRAKTRNEPEAVVWGTGAPRREALHVDDLADACVLLMNQYDESEMINVGSGEDISIKELALLIREVAGFKGEIVFDKSKPDGAPRKLLDDTRIRKLGWVPKISLEKGIRQTYQWYENYSGAK